MVVTLKLSDGLDGLKVESFSLISTISVAMRLSSIFSVGAKISTSNIGKLSNGGGVNKVVLEGSRDSKDSVTIS